MPRREVCGRGGGEQTLPTFSAPLRPPLLQAPHLISPPFMMGSTAALSERPGCWMSLCDVVPNVELSGLSFAHRFVHVRAREREGGGDVCERRFWHSPCRSRLPLPTRDTPPPPPPRKHTHNPGTASAKSISPSASLFQQAPGFWGR